MTEFQIAAVIGDPIAQSKSPRIHRHWLNRYGVDGDYMRIEVAEKDLAAALRHLQGLGFRGINVTIPHKIAILDHADEITPTAQAIGAANTLFFENGLIIADNTDAYGFMANLDQNAPNWDKSKPSVILGAGGAARAVVYGLLRAGLPKVTIVNRTAAKAQSLARDLGADWADWSELPDVMQTAGLLVNTTSLGMQGQPRLDLDLSPLCQSALVTDIVYAPLLTDLLDRAQQRGNPIVDGLGMLLHQAVPGFERWFGLRPKVDTALREEVLK